MPDFHLIEVRSSSDPRDSGSRTGKRIGRHSDGEGLRLIAQAMSEISAKARAEFMAGPHDRSFEDRHAAIDVHEKRIQRFFPVSLRGDIVSFRVKEVPEPPMVDLDALRGEFLGDDQNEAGNGASK